MLKNSSKVLIFLLFVTFTQAQNLPTCDPSIVEWLPHPTDCTLYIICFHGNAHVMRCAPTLHFNRATTQCMLPEHAQCELDYMCPPVDDPLNPIFIPNEEDCSR